MFIIDHEIAGITFRTESDVEIISIKREFFDRFSIRGSNPDIYHRLHGIDQGNLTLSPLSPEEKSRFSVLSFPNFIAPGTLTLPNLRITSTHPEFLPRDPLCVPLLQSPRVRSRLEACLDHPEQVVLELHMFSVVIRDSIRRVIEVFYPLERAELFKTSYIEPGFRRMFSWFLPAFSALMVHSSAVDRNGSAALFLAPDKGGKTTVAETSTDSVVLSDDQNVLKKDGDIINVYGTPWGSVSSPDQGTKLGGIFLLEKAKDFKLIPLRPADAIRYYWQEHSFYHTLLPKHLKVKTFQTIYDACHQVPVYRMCFPKDYVDWDAIDSVMDGNIAG